MSRYHIPEAFRPGFILISNLSDDDAQIIADTLNNSDFGLNTKKIVNSLSEKVSIDEKELKEVTKTIYSILSFGNNSLEKTAQDLVSSIEDQIDEIDKDRLDQLYKYLLLFIAVKGKTLQTVKAYQILRENEKNYLSSKVVTDVRIVFEDELNKQNLTNAVLVHNLKIRFTDSESGETRSVFFALDSNDISDFKTVLTRAQEKEKLIREDKGMDCLSFLSLDKD